VFDRSLDLRELRLQALGRCFITIRAKRMQGVQVVLTLLLQSCAFAFDLLLGPSVLALRAATRRS
jgi:hypothetical protein